MNPVDGGDFGCGMPNGYRLGALEEYGLHASNPMMGPA